MNLVETGSCEVQVALPTWQVLCEEDFTVGFCRREGGGMQQIASSPVYTYLEKQFPDMHQNHLEGVSSHKS